MNWMPNFSIYSRQKNLFYRWKTGTNPLIDITPNVHECRSLEWRSYNAIFQVLFYSERLWRARKWDLKLAWRTSFTVYTFSPHVAEGKRKLSSTNPYQWDFFSYQTFIKSILSISIFSPLSLTYCWWCKRLVWKRSRFDPISFFSLLLSLKVSYLNRFGIRYVTLEYIVLLLFEQRGVWTS